MIFIWCVRKIIIVFQTCLIKVTKEIVAFTIKVKLANNFFMSVFYLDVYTVHCV